MQKVLPSFEDPVNVSTSSGEFFIYFKIPWLYRPQIHTPTGNQ